MHEGSQVVYTESHSMHLVPGDVCSVSGCMLVFLHMLKMLLQKCLFTFVYQSMSCIISE